jgi:predicted 3-demethylubiquinone-9 3-methyltransferase (glyoxalase superfamily)
MQKITPFLWFDNQAEEAVKFYTSIFKNSKVGRIFRYTEEAAEKTGRPVGSVLTIEFEIERPEICRTQRRTTFQIQ